MCKKEYLEQADEIYILYQHRDLIYDVLDDYPKADVIIDYAVEESLPWDMLTAANETHNNRCSFHFSLQIFTNPKINPQDTQL